jgi:predicted HTH domain antitoxin
MSVSVVFPEEILTAVREDRAQFTRQVMIYTLGHFYEQGRLSSGLGAKILGCDRWEFYRLLSEHGFAVIDYPADELEAESLSSHQLADYLKERDAE